MSEISTYISRVLGGYKKRERLITTEQTTREDVMELAYLGQPLGEGKGFL